MNDKSTPKEIPIPDYDQDNQLNEYKYLLMRLKDIKDTINLLENKFLSKDI